MNLRINTAASGNAATDKGADRRQRILAAARRRFAASGFETATVRQIADDAGLLAGSLYYHFANKEEMLHEAVRGTVLRLSEGAREIGGGSADAEARIVALIFFDVAERTAHHEVHAILHQERAYFRGSPEFDYVVAARREHYLVWRSLIEEGIAQGLFRADINVYLTLTTIIRMFTLGADWFLHDDRAVIDAAGIASPGELGAFYVNFVLRALRVSSRIEAAIPWPEDAGPA